MDANQDGVIELNELLRYLEEVGEGKMRRGHHWTHDIWTDLSLMGSFAYAAGSVLFIILAIQEVVERSEDGNPFEDIWDIIAFLGEITYLIGSAAFISLGINAKKAKAADRRKQSRELYNFFLSAPIPANSELASSESGGSSV